MTIGYLYRSNSGTDSRSLRSCVAPLPRARPPTLYLNVTNRCSNSCAFCVRQRPDFSLAGYNMRLSQEPTAAEVLHDIERFVTKEGVFDEVVFCGFGEPTYRLELINEVGCNLRSRGIPVRLNTNGQAELIAGADPFPLLSPALDAVSISLNAPDAVTYEQLCQPTFDNAYEAVIAFAERSVTVFDEVILSVVGTTLDEEGIKRCAEISDRLQAGFRVR